MWSVGCSWKHHLGGLTRTQKPLDFRNGRFIHVAELDSVRSSWGSQLLESSENICLASLEFF